MDSDLNDDNLLTIFREYARELKELKQLLTSYASRLSNPYSDKWMTGKEVEKLS